MYEAGETAKGALLIEADKGLKVRKLKFSVCGKERYERGVAEECGDSCEEYDIFLSEDLTPYLKPTFVFSQADENSKIEITQGTSATLFHFTISPNALELYRCNPVRLVHNMCSLQDSI